MVIMRKRKYNRQKSQPFLPEHFDCSREKEKYPHLLEVENNGNDFSQR